MAGPGCELSPTTRSPFGDSGETVAQADPCPRGVAVTGACSARGAPTPPQHLPTLLLLSPGWALS